MTNLYRVGGNGNPSDANQIIDALRGENDVGVIQAYPKINPPGAITAAINTTTGNLTGDYQYKVAFITGYWKGPVGTGTLYTQGNTGGGPASNTVSPSGQQVNLSGIPIGGTGVVARAIYRTKAGGSTFYFLQQINDNVSTTWVDNIADSALTQVMPTTNTTGSYFSGDGHGLTNLQGVVLPDGSIPMTGPLTLPGDPAQPLQAATKQYVDSFSNSIPAPTPISLSNGQQIITTTKAGMMQNFKVLGRTLVNLLGRLGLMATTGKMYLSSVTEAFDTTNYAIGTASLKYTASGTTAVDHYFNFGAPYVPITAGQYYLLVAMAKPNVGQARMRAIVWNGASGGTVLLDNSADFTDTTKFTSKHIAFQAPTNSVSLEVRGHVLNASGASQYIPAGTAENANFNGYRLFALTQAQYNEIATLTEDQIAAKYPYVNDVKHLSGLYVIRYGENLLDNSNVVADVTNGGTKTIIDPYTMSISKTSTSSSDARSLSVPVVAGQNYVFTSNLTISGYGGSGGAYIQLNFYDASGALIGTQPASAVQTANGTYTLTASGQAPSGAVSVLAYFLIGTNPTGTFTWSNWRLNIGTVDKGFKQRNDDMMVFPVSFPIGSNVDQSVVDEIYHRDGRYWRENRFVKDMVLDGSLSWAYSATATGYKEVKVPFTNQASGNKQTVVKYDGKILVNVSSPTSGDQCAMDGSYLYVEVSSADTGWGDSYTPTAAEIQAYFYGWKMYLSGSYPTVYNGTGTKAWVRITDGQAATLTLPTSYASGGPPYIPYKITYQLATPTWDDLTEIMEGEIHLLEGPNMVEVGVGMILRERIQALDTNNTVGGYFNGSGNTQSFPKHPVNKIIALYGNGANTSATIAAIASGAANQNIRGLQQAYIPFSKYDPTATYEATYQALDQYLITPSAVTTITAEYDTNIKTVLDRLGQSMADYGQRLSVAEMLAARTFQVPFKTLQSITYYVDGTNGSDSGDGSAARPFKTIGKAVSMIPQVLNHTYTISIAPGTYAEDVLIVGIVGSGLLVIQGDSMVSTSRSVQSIYVQNCGARITIKGMNFTTTTRNCVDTAACAYVNVQYCNMVSNNTQWGIRSGASTVYAFANTISNQTIALIADSGGTLYSENNNGNNNQNALYAYLGGKIATAGTQPTAASATNNSYALSGGMIVGNPVVNPWGDNTLSSRSSSRANHTAQQSLSANVATKIVFNKQYDNLGELDSNGRFTAKHSGEYLFTVGLGFVSNAASFIAQLWVYVNGTQVDQVAWLGVYSNLSYSTFPVSAFKCRLNAGDYVEIYVIPSITISTNPDNRISFFEETQIA
ncbi:hypothetical protein SD70_02585 [Gordoniibacillus kamchatkensis]|uniref:C1q domain-containing protein n=1 Tax=Gordoniibacillus kamchatkensis TaxID=1590651 RepID=A0ABR5AM40_9BACL|nr:hypothetical protein [Paenibacillus sp. VKM B-2647]KIL42090.1 hypothetical protein SD70_02585 [Paenibacillus sp. VKM B-2647]